MNQTAASIPLGPPPPSAPALERWMWRLRRWWPPFNFLLGIASFLLVNRQVAMGSWIAGFLMLSWLLILFEGTLGRWLSAWRPDWAQASPWMLRFLTQGVHQESFFFALPFLLHTTTWTSPQALFTLVVAGAALASMWDPFYYGRIGHRAGVFLAYHALAVYVTMLVLLPALGHVTTQTTTAIAAIAIAVLSVPSLAQLFDRRRWWRWLAMFAGAGALGFAALLAAPFVPPATLWISQGAISASVDVAQREPGPEIRRIDEDRLRAQGLYAFSAIRAPRGLRESIYHRWMLNGEEIDRIPLHIEGGREQGYRAWTRKTGFPADARGRWQVQVVTDGGQLIGEMRFRVD